jgi:integrase
VGQGLERLTALAVTRLRKRGYYNDGGGLYLQVAASGSKSWVFRFRSRTDGRLREMGLGSFQTVSLADAREQARECRRRLLAGNDPIQARNDEREALKATAAQSVTFEYCAQNVIESRKAEWRNNKSAKQWSATFARYVYPSIGAKGINEISVTNIMEVLKPIWQEKAETAKRVRGRIELVFRWAIAMGHRRGENPARWEGLIDRIAPAHRKFVRVKHHAALPFEDLPAFMLDLRSQNGIAAAAMEFAILTAGRTGEVIGATWDEMSIDRRTWTIPAQRMKAGREHRVPLSTSAISLLRRMEHLRNGEAVFPSQRKGHHLSNMALLKVLKRMERSDITTHGFRSTFRDWASECTDTPNEVVEMALAHTIGNAVEAAYRRGDLFEKRRKLMGDWAEFCGTAAIGKVLNLPG